MTMHLIAACHSSTRTSKPALDAMRFESPRATAFVYPPEPNQPRWATSIYCNRFNRYRSFDNMADALDYAARLLQEGF